MKYDYEHKKILMATVVSAVSMLVLGFIAAGCDIYDESTRFDDSCENKKLLISKLESINNRKIQKTADTIEIDGQKFIISNVVKNNGR